MYYQYILRYILYYIYYIYSIIILQYIYIYIYCNIYIYWSNFGNHTWCAKKILMNDSVNFNVTFVVFQIRSYII